MNMVVPGLGIVPRWYRGVCIGGPHDRTWQTFPDGDIWLEYVKSHPWSHITILVEEASEVPEPLIGHGVYQRQNYYWMPDPAIIEDRKYLWTGWNHCLTMFIWTEMS